MNENQQNGPCVVGLGEVLWDMLPAGRQLGGAPANVAFHAAALGGSGAVASCVGDDDLGAEIRHRLTEAGLDDSAVAIDPDLPTGTVTVELDADGKPAFTIHTGVAWDAMPYTPELDVLMARADAVCFGSLAQRAGGSRETIRRALAATRPECLLICDVNLRQRYYTRKILAESFALANVLKLNDEELPVIAKLLGVPAEADAAMAALVERFSLRLVILTCGAAGSVLRTPAETSRLSGEPVAVVDSVGAGDAFTAAVAIGVLRDESLAAIHVCAERVARYVCTQAGATPALPPELRYADA